MLAARETRAYAWSVRHGAHHLRAAELVAQHTSPPAGGWELAVEIANHHSEMLNELVGGPRASFPSDVAVVPIATHALTFYTEILGAGARGMFDAAAPLFGGLVDWSGLVFALAAASGGVEAFLSGEPGLAAKGRRVAVGVLTFADPDNATKKDVEWLDRQQDLHRMAHVSLFHADSVIAQHTAGWRPSVGGRLSLDTMGALCKAAMNADNELMMHLIYVSNGRISADWGGRLAQLQARVNSWSQEPVPEVPLPAGLHTHHHEDIVALKLGSGATWRA